MERAGDGWGQTEGYCSTGQSPHRAVAPLEEEEEEEEEEGEEEEIIPEVQRRFQTRNFTVLRIPEAG